ncbi:hypothetical protein GSI_03196 [Ganoderma sinense ZZ0214-1]|uniref:Uncharacterized protein n=1 Tax=Ganoderma sinense ZZ0214-1 TaxID=1077348 RepID=A0A2G8SKY3_9APHY|nr:hypothetical protein GSI_03196 [Ganoderma sinense ZZ0214-1]
MRLLDTHTGQFVEKDPSPVQVWREKVKYAILSHTWDADGEQTHKELMKIQKRYVGECLFPVAIGPDGLVPALSAIWQDPNLSPKIRDACRVAREDGYQYLWIDSCCIDKTSSSELSEAINSMFAWYKWATICYAYLADVPPLSHEDKDQSSLKDEDKDSLENKDDDLQVQVGRSAAFRLSRWFKRGWTLQELLAPEILIFLSKDWKPLGSKKELSGHVNAITKISVDALSNQRLLSKFSVAQRLSWASNRRTTRVEDRAYSLLGIFNINMPTLYGEGKRAFQRLQEEILRRIPDQSIFAFCDSRYFPSRRSPHVILVDNLDPGLKFWYQDESKGYNKRISCYYSSSSSMLSTSPDNFLRAHRIPLAQLIYHYPDLPPLDYSFTPYGILTHIPLIPLSVFQSDIPIEYEGENSEWYLAVLGCELVDHPGRLLARACRLIPSTSGTNILSRGRKSYVVKREKISIFSDSKSDFKKVHISGDNTDIFFALSASVLVQTSPLARVFPVYLSQDDQDHEIFDEDITRRPHKTINLMLKKNGTPGPCSSGSPNGDKPTTTLSLRWPDRDNPNTHWLTISRPAWQGAGDVRDTITIEYRHILEDDGNSLSIIAHASGMLGGYPTDSADITWKDEMPWETRYLDSQKMVILENGKGGRVKVDLSLEYLAINNYLIDAHTTWFNKRPCLEPEDGNTTALVPPLDSEDYAPGPSEDPGSRRALEDGSVAPQGGAKRSRASGRLRGGLIAYRR